MPYSLFQNIQIKIVGAVMLLCCLSPFLSHAQLVLREGIASVDVEPQHLLHFSTQQRKLQPIDGLEQAYAAGAFQPLAQTSLAFGISEESHYFYFELENQSGNSDWILLFDFPQHSKLQLHWRVKGQKEWSSHLVGASLPFYDRPIPYSGGFAFPMKVTEGKPIELCFGLWSDRTKIVPIRFMTPKEFLGYKTLKDVFHGCFSGVILGLFFYNLFLLIGLRDRAYLYYILSLLSTLLVFSATSGHAFQFLVPNSPDALRRFFPFFSAGIGLTIGLFGQYFLQTKSYIKWLHYALSVLIGISAVCVAASPFFSPFLLDLIVYPVLSIEGPLLLLAGIIRWMQGYRPAIYYTFAWAGYIIGGVGLLGRDMGLFPVTFLTSHGAEIGAVLECLLISFSLSNRYQILKQEKEKADQELLKIQRATAASLEKKVKQRTQELRDANEGLNQVNEELTQTLEVVNIEKEKNEKLLLNILPAPTAKELKEKGKATSRHYEQATVMFTDFKGFTKISESLSPDELVENLDYCFKHFDRVLRKHGVEKVKTIGDAYMCVSGVPVAVENSALPMISAAMEINVFMAKWQAEKASRGEEPWELRIGIHTGPLVAGVVGEDKFAYDVWGDTVNIASRIESNSEPGKINISESTYKLIKGVYGCKHRGKVEAKHKGELEMYFVEDAL